MGDREAYTRIMWGLTESIIIEPQVLEYLISWYATYILRWITVDDVPFELGLECL